MGKIAENVKSSVQKIVEISIQKGIQEGLQALELDLSACQKHHEELSAIKQRENKLKHQVEVLENENKHLSDKLENLESYTRRNNVKILGLKESKDENCRDTVITLLAEANICLAPTAHRIYSSTMPRPIIVQFLFADKKQLLLKSCEKIKERAKITVVDDIPDELRAARKILSPILYKAKADFGDGRARIRGNKLIVNDRVYSVNDLESLPQQLRPSNVFTRSKDNSVAFYTKMSPFSNHFQSNFRIEGIEFNCCEQFYMYSKALHFNDKQQADNILKATDPVIQKRLGSKIARFKKDVWNKRSQSVMETGLFAKFKKNPSLKDILLSTDEKILIEANKYDRYWSCGLPLFDNKIWSQKEWKGQNTLGQLLMKVRERLK